MTKNTHDADVAFIRALAESLNVNDLTELQVKRDYAEVDSLNLPGSRKPPQQIETPPQLDATRARRQSAPGREGGPRPAPPRTTHPPPPPHLSLNVPCSHHYGLHCTRRHGRLSSWQHWLPKYLFCWVSPHVNYLVL